MWLHSPFTDILPQCSTLYSAIVTFMKWTPWSILKQPCLYHTIWERAILILRLIQDIFSGIIQLYHLFLRVYNKKIQNWKQNQNLLYFPPKGHLSCLNCWVKLSKYFKQWKNFHNMHHIINPQNCRCDGVQVIPQRPEQGWLCYGARKEVGNRERTSSCLGELSEPETTMKHKDIIRLSTITFCKQINHKKTMDWFIWNTMKSHLFLTVL